MKLRLLDDQSGAAAVEMALVTPFLIVLMFGSFELGKYFLDNHVVAKAVREGARFASRQGFSKFSCDSPATVDSGVVTSVQNLTRTNQVTSGGAPRLGYWTDLNSANAKTVTVTLRCDTSGIYGNFYEGMAGVPVVTVSVSVDYNSLFSNLGFNTSGIRVASSSEVPVMGI